MRSHSKIFPKAGATAPAFLLPYILTYGRTIDFPDFACGNRQKMTRGRKLYFCPQILYNMEIIY